MTRTAVIAALAGLALTGVTWTAQAALNTLPNTSVGTLTLPTLGGWNVQISNCSETLHGTSQTGIGGCSNEQVIASTLPSGALSLVFTGIQGTGPTMLFPTAADNSLSDLTFTESITGPSGRTVASVGQHVDGTGTNTDLATDTSTITASTPSGNTPSQANGTPLDSLLTFSSLSNAITATKDIRGGSALASGSNNLSFNSLTQTFSLSVPEPASLSMMLVGVAGLIGFRRRR